MGGAGAGSREAPPASASPGAPGRGPGPLPRRRPSARAPGGGFSSSSQQLLLRRAREGQRSPLARHSRRMRISFGTIYFLVLENSWVVLAVLASVLYALFVVIGGAVALAVPLVSEMEEVEGEVSQFLLALRFAAGNTIALGLGPVFPLTEGGYVLASVQQFVGILLNALLLACVLAKFQAPHADIIFSAR